MRVDKVIVRAVLSTLTAIIVLFGSMILALCFIYPSTMMNITYDLGMDKASVKYATRVYNRTDEVYYIAFATETAIGADLDEKIEECGLTFVKDDEFANYCNDRDTQMNLGGSYAQYIYGQISLAQYRQNKKTQAIETAFNAISGNTFPNGNAVQGLALTALMAGDSEVAHTIYEKMMNMESGLFSEKDRQPFDALLSLLGK